MTNTSTVGDSVFEETRGVAVLDPGVLLAHFKPGRSSGRGGMKEPRSQGKAMPSSKRRNSSGSMYTVVLPESSEVVTKWLGIILVVFNYTVCPIIMCFVMRIWI